MDLILTNNEPAVVVTFMENYEHFLTHPCKPALQQVRKSGNLLIEYLNFIIEKSEKFFLRFLEEIHEYITRIVKDISLKGKKLNQLGNLIFLRENVFNSLEFIRSHMKEEDKTVDYIMKNTEQRRKEQTISQQKNVPLGQNKEVRELLGIDQNPNDNRSESERRVEESTREERKEVRMWTKNLREKMLENYVYVEGAGPVHKSMFKRNKF